MSGTIKEGYELEENRKHENVNLSVNGVHAKTPSPNAGFLIVLLGFLLFGLLACFLRRAYSHSTVPRMLR